MPRKNLNDLVIFLRWAVRAWKYGWVSASATEVRAKEPGNVRNKWSFPASTSRCFGGGIAFRRAGFAQREVSGYAAIHNALDWANGLNLRLLFEFLSPIAIRFVATCGCLGNGFRRAGILQIAIATDLLVSTGLLPPRQGCTTCGLRYAFMRPYTCKLQ